MKGQRCAVRAIGAVTALLLLAACGGPTAEEWQGAQSEIARLKGDLDAANKRYSEEEDKYAEASAQIRELQSKLQELAAEASSTQTEASRRQEECESLLVSCRARDCSPCGSPSGAQATWSAPEQSAPAARSTIAPAEPASAPSYVTIPYPGNGGGPTLCADGSVSGSSGRGTCSHHGGISGGHHRKH
jgi:hypothetical protein